ncbi:stress-response A/B barrel domain-containing protein HS1-like [Salvia miltiorrhiza]|uniref:stress-response A/B barrel domain-containing protein HS1-like n=1 Tax=Salvia miltiorrhiza TaxID=226208 RepID=UPI0025AD7D7B|nr:stress-response A/B barrel domain-containing protein HS1-like [Salvia miltiorrhiza]
MMTPLPLSVNTPLPSHSHHGHGASAHFPTAPAPASPFPTRGSRRLTPEFLRPLLDSESELRRSSSSAVSATGASLYQQRSEIVMEETKEELKHIVLAKFKDGLSEQQIDEYIKEYANLVNLVPSLKAFRWGKDVGIGNKQQGFTHVFELSFESTQGIAEYISHPNHVDYANRVLPQLEKLISVDYKPT